MANEKQETVIQEVPEKLTPQQAIHVLIQCAELCQKSGLLSLKDASTVSKAVEVFVTQQAPGPGTETATAETTTGTPKKTTRKGRTPAKKS